MEHYGIARVCPPLTLEIAGAASALWVKIAALQYTAYCICMSVTLGTRGLEVATKRVSNNVCSVGSCYDASHSATPCRLIGLHFLYQTSSAGELLGFPGWLLLRMMKIGPGSQPRALYLFTGRRFFAEKSVHTSTLAKPTIDRYF